MPGDKQIKVSEITHLITKGRKQGFLLFSELDKTFKEDQNTGDDFNAFLNSMDDYGIKIIDRQSRNIRPKRRKSDIVSLEGLERTTDPVKLYLREMGNISLLTREGEISIAREIERGEKNIIKALSKTKMVLNEALSLEGRMEDEPEILQEMFDFSEDEIAEGKIEKKKKQIMDQIHAIEILIKDLDKIKPLKRNTITRGRIIVEMSRMIRDLHFRPFYREQVIETLREKLKVINELE
ncbi:MAG: sigma-70 factor domain-containing protein, partial [Candidatus Aminicenantaceae bacterium]